MVLIFGMMIGQSVTDDVNEYYWTVEAGDTPSDDPEVVVGADGSDMAALCADAGAANPDAADGMWTWEGQQF